METDRLEEAKESGFELRDVNTRGLTYFLLATAAFLAIICAAVQGLFGLYARTDVPKPAVAGPFVKDMALPEPPRIQTQPERDIREYRDAEDRLLQSSGWIDQKSGVARIPIDRAMQLLLRQGLPTQAAGSRTAAPASAGTTRRNETKQNGTQREPDNANPK